MQNTRNTYIIAIIIVALASIIQQQPVKNSAYKLDLHLFAFSLFIASLIAINPLLKRIISLNKYDVIFISILIILTIITSLNYNPYTDLNIVENTYYGLLLYMPIKIIIDNHNPKQIRFASLALIGSTAILLLLALLKSPNFSQINFRLFNSTYFSNYLALLFPLLFIIFKNTKYKIISRCALLLMIAIAAICLANNARASIFGIIAFILLQLDLKSILKQKTALVITGFPTLALLTYLLLVLKPGSINGRWWIWKNSINILVNNPTGIGLGNFKQVYTSYQSKQLLSSSESEAFLLSDINDYAFNDILQLLVEGGLVLIIPIVLILYLIIRSKNKYLLGFTILVIIISSTSYILHSLPTLVVVLISFCTVLGKKEFRTKHTLHPSAYLIVIYIGLIWSCLGYISYKAKDFKTILSNFYKNLDNKYLFDLGMQAYEKGEYEKSISLLKKSGMEDYDIDLNITTGICYEKMGNEAIAERYFIKANQILPRIFKPKYYLFNFYRSKKNYSKAKIVAKEIIATPVKVSSKPIEDLKAEAKNFINSF